MKKKYLPVEISIDKLSNDVIMTSCGSSLLGSYGDEGEYGWE